ncbi:Hypothetical_protein [Hexamita inflata]|uniref:Hypothetical_protein n=1 Tax=Hexamita inflata TaxID=28002 RepID=A0AA86TQS6_9EUKA|nr:Hypothetical protein HINF_LOCUS12886 [Hexamita inflata]
MQSPNCLFHFKHFEVTGKLEASHADNSVRKFDQAEIFALLNIARAIDSKLDESQLKNTKPFVEFPCLQQRYLVSWPNSVQASMLLRQSQNLEKHKLESLNFARMNLKQPIEYWRTFQYTMSIAQNAMQIERVECSEHLKTSGSEVFSRSVKYGLFSCMIYSTISYRYKGPLWFMPWVRP